MNDFYNENSTFIGLKKTVTLTFVASTFAVASPEYELNVFDRSQMEVCRPSELPLFERNVDFVKSLDDKAMNLDAEEFSAALSKLEWISKQEKGWDGYDADPISQNSLELTKSFLKALNVVKGLIVGWDVSPTGRKTVQIEKTTDNGYFEIEFFEDGKMSCYSDVAGASNCSEIRRINDAVRWVINVVS